jgi:hypothetical protein
MTPKLQMHLKAYLGKETTATVYAAELVGIYLALSITIGANRPRVAIFTDN